MVLTKQGQVINMLKFDKQGLANEILKNFKNELSWVLDAWKNEVIKGMRYNEFKSNADLDFVIKSNTKSVIAYLEANTYVLADSYGTGSLMLTSNPGYEAYRRSSSWNKYRTGRAIAGREAGDYIDIFGKQHHTSGIYKGKTLEGRYVRGGFKIEPVAPSYAIQIAEQWLYKTYLPRAYSNAVKNTNFGKYLIES